MNMTDLKRSVQTDSGAQSSMASGEEGANGPDNQGAEFGTSERGTRGTNRDADASGESMNQGHGHSREERGANTD
jgi:hypothetical protein